MDRVHSQRYTDYLASVEWQAKRQELFALRGRCCEDCGATANITVHHLTYERLGHEALSDLEVLCWDCHAKLEARKKPRISPPEHALPVKRSRAAPKMTREQLDHRRELYLQSKYAAEAKARQSELAKETARHNARLVKEQIRHVRERNGQARLRQLERYINRQSR